LLCGLVLIALGPHILSAQGQDPNVSGTVTLQGLVATATPEPITFAFRTPGSTNVLFTKMAQVGPKGTFHLGGVPTGAYDIAIKGAKWLRQVVKGVNVTGNLSGVTATLRTGDVNGDNRVDILDLGLLSDAFNTRIGQSGFNANADLNGDKTVDILDLGLLADNFGQVGDP
jgi:hypothetical protein